MANETVIVGCKLPNGLVLQVGNKRVTVRGSAHYMQPNPARKFQEPEIIYADSITLVDKAFWEAWLAQTNKKFPVESGGFGPLVSKALYANPTKDTALGMARDTEKERSGLEQNDPAHIEGVKPYAAQDNTPVPKIM